MKSLLPLFLIALFVTSCRPPRDLEFRAIQNIEIENIGFSSAQLKADLLYYNPNNFGLELNRADLDLYIDSIYFGHSNQDFQVAIPRREEFIIPVKVDLDIKNLLRNGLTALSKKEVRIRALGSVKLGKGGVYKSFPVDYTTIQQLKLY